MAHSTDPHQIAYHSEPPTSSILYKHYPSFLEPRIPPVYPSRNDNRSVRSGAQAFERCSLDLRLADMAMEYINYIKAKAHISSVHKSEQPVLSREDEEFLNRITSDGTHSNDAQIALLDGAQNIALPDTPTELSEEPAMIPSTSETKPTTSKKSTWSWLRRDSRSRAADGLQDIADNLKSPDAKPNEDRIVDDKEAKKEEEDMMIVLERLNLAAVNNRVFSISDETQELLQKFNQVFKDLINGVPTAYGDLESLLTNGDKQLQKTYNSLPSFLQKLIQQLPGTFTKGLAPTMMAAAAERGEKSGINMQAAGKAAGLAKKMGFKTPALKDLVSKPGAIAGMVRSIMAFLRARFPAFMGMNVLWSLALFILLFVFWYCYKRGREERLERERALTEKEVKELDEAYRNMDMNDIRTTTAAQGASIAEVRAGMMEVEAMKKEATEGNAARMSDIPQEPAIERSTDVVT